MSRNTAKAAYAKKFAQAGVPFPPKEVYFTSSQYEAMLGSWAVKPNSKKPKAESDEDISNRIKDKFQQVKDIVRVCLEGDRAFRATVVSGDAGLGKTAAVEEVLTKWDPAGTKHKHVKGYVRATGLFKLLYEFRQPGKVLVFDDADGVFLDSVALGLLKAVCDTLSKRGRVVSWLSEATFETEDTKEVVPRTFEFEGSIVFITNYDMQEMIERGVSLAPHLQALVSRSHYVDVGMRTPREKVVRIEQVAAAGLFKDNLDGDVKAQREVLAFMRKHADRFQELSLRSAIKLSGLRRVFPHSWENMAKDTMFSKEV